MNARRKQRKRKMRMKQILPKIIWCQMAMPLYGTCLAYTAAPGMRRSTAKEIFEFPSYRRNVLRQARPHRRSISKKKKTTAIGMATNNAGDGKPLYRLVKKGDRDDFYQYGDWLFDDRKQRVAFYGSLAFLETIFWYWLAPGIDPQSRWFNPLDGQLIANLLDPSTVFSPPAGSGLGFSSLLLNTFLILPMVWSLLLLQEEEEERDEVLSGLSNDTIPKNSFNRITSAIRNCVCACGFLVGGGILIPYMIFRRPMPFRRSIDPERFPAPLKLFEEQNWNSLSNPISVFEPIGRSFLLLLVSVVLISFLLPFANQHCYWGVEWNAFLDRAHSSQFTSLALYDFAMISIAVLDPMMDDAMRRSYVPGWETDGNRDRWRSEKRTSSILAIAPYLVIPLIGPVAWICLRPRYDLGTIE